MNFIQRAIARLLKPFLDALRAEMHAVVVQEVDKVKVEFATQTDLCARQSDLTTKQTDFQLRKDIYAELKRVGAAIGELQSRVSFTTQTPDNLTSLGERLDVLEKVLIAATEPRKPGNHITPGHQFGNRINW
jgi:paraquat-inducible protein B